MKYRMFNLLLFRRHFTMLDPGRSLEPISIIHRYLAPKARKMRKIEIIVRLYNCTPQQNVLEAYDTDYIRNFCIIAHVDHGKSTLADRLLEYTGTIKASDGNKQVLDKLQVERDRGITVKAQTASMFFSYKGKDLLLNLIDTPGHVDFSYEVSRSFAACQGALLVIDATQGIQAQTAAHYYLALEQGVHVIPIINKIDLPTAKPDIVGKELENFFGFPQRDIIYTSAKTGAGIDKVIKTICESIPPPSGKRFSWLAALLIDSWYDQFKGVVCQMSIAAGCLEKGYEIHSCYSGQSYEVNEVGILNPGRYPTQALYAGQVGYTILGMKNTKEALIGDTFSHVNRPVKALPGFQRPKPMVFSGFYPVDQSIYPLMRKALEKLSLNDSSVTYQPDSSQALGQGWRMGFMGLLHMDVFKQRIEQEHGLEVIITSPNVPYKAFLKSQGQSLDIISPSDFPDYHKVEYFEEPVVIGTIICPEGCLGKIITLCEEKRGEQIDLNIIQGSRVIVKYKLPLAEVVLDFFGDLKSLSSGYATFDYEDGGYQETQLEKVEILLNGKTVDSLTFLVHKSQVRDTGKHMCHKLKDIIQRQMFEIVIQAANRKTIIARETIKPFRKNVIAKCYGGDITRKRKLLDRQKEGKKNMKKIGNVEIPYSAFAAILKR